jgi:hypothetical protein
MPPAALTHTTAASASQPACTDGVFETEAVLDARWVIDGPTRLLKLAHHELDAVGKRRLRWHMLDRQSGAEIATGEVAPPGGLPADAEVFWYGGAAVGQDLIAWSGGNKLSGLAKDIIDGSYDAAAETPFTPESLFYEVEFHVFHGSAPPARLAMSLSGYGQGPFELPGCNCALLPSGMSPSAFSLQDDAGKQVGHYAGVKITAGPNPSLAPWGPLTQEDEDSLVDGYAQVVHDRVVFPVYNYASPGNEDDRRAVRFYALDGARLHQTTLPTIADQSCYESDDKDAVCIPAADSHNVQQLFVAGRDAATWVVRAPARQGSSGYAIDFTLLSSTGAIDSHRAHCGLGDLLIWGTQPRADGGGVVVYSGDGEDLLLAWDRHGRIAHRYRWPDPGRSFGKWGDLLWSIRSAGEGSARLVWQAVNAWGWPGCPGADPCGACDDGDPATVDDCSEAGACVYGAPLFRCTGS